MSTRWYPLYAKGNPQLRVFIPNFWMKLVKPKEHTPLPANEISFEVSMEMTKHDVKNYLEKIYKVPVVDVRTHIQMGEVKKQPVKGYMIKDDDFKMAFVTLPKDYKFSFPELIPKDTVLEEEKDLKSLQDMKDDFQRTQFKNKERLDVPSWFGL